ncbi:MAG TPA: FecR domain-containing protein [Candidatus Sulfotelmatobacter sp.]|jgi:transmembrane sensor|nr:FecR domain-containing protein [Candidatus Sulfotelmatobacter sp.]
MFDFLSCRQSRCDRQAAEWLLRAENGESSVADGLQRWLARSSRNRAAYRRARQAWGMMGQAELPVPRPVAVMRPRLAWAGAMAAALAVTIGWWEGGERWSADFSTGVAEQRMIGLEDGSQLWLGPDSAVDVRFDSGERRVVLRSGEVYAVAAPRNGAEPRPFLVHAGNGSVRALGTRFNVNVLPDGTEVTVEEHAVEVRADAADGSQEHSTLSAGQSLRYGSDGVGSSWPVEPSQAGAWRKGHLVADRQPLGDVVAELNRYRHGRIIITDTALSRRMVSGVFDTRDPDAALEVITSVLKVHSLSLPPLITLLY